MINALYVETQIATMGYTFNHQVHKEYEIESMLEHFNNHDYDGFDETYFHNAISHSELSMCDNCKEIDLSQQLHLVEEEAVGGREDEYLFVCQNHNVAAVCDSCLTLLSKGCQSGN